MKTFGVFLVTICVLLLSINIVVGVKASYKLEKEITSNWNLADKASTIEQKSEYIDKFVTSLEQQNYQGTYNAVIFPTPDNSYDENIKALKSLQSRLEEIKTMDPSSFEYQTAIQQITQQEQSEANAMLIQLKGLWWKNNHFLLWNWVGLLNYCFLIVIGIVGIVIIEYESY